MRPVPKAETSESESSWQPVRSPEMSSFADTMTISICGSVQMGVMGPEKLLPETSMYLSAGTEPKADTSPAMALFARSMKARESCCSLAPMETRSTPSP